jgi:hypothetical protein
MGAPHDLPTAAELVAAVRDWLALDVGTDRGTGEGAAPNRFHVRVAANTLSIVERELQLADEHAAAHARRLEQLDVADDGELAAAIRSGRIDYRDPVLCELVWASVRDKLDVANPRYVDRARA